MFSDGRSWEELSKEIYSFWRSSGRINEAWEDLEEYEKDSYYENFEDSGRWDIGRAFIYQFTEDGKFYRIWRTVGLTEMQETYFEDQTPQVVEEKSRRLLGLNFMGLAPSTYRPLIILI